MLEHLKLCFSAHTHSTVPAYMRIRDAIESLIRAGELGPGAKLASVRDIARVCGVTPATAGRAVQLLSQEGLVVTRGGSGVFVGAEATSPDDMHIWFCLHPTFLTTSRETVFRRLSGITEAAQRRRITLHPVTAPEDFDPDMFEADKWGVIFFDRNYVHDGFDEVARCVQERQVVSCVAHYCDGPFPCVPKFHQQACELATSYLLRLGHRRIALFSVSPQSGLGCLDEEMKTGYFSAFRKRQISHPATLYAQAESEAKASFAAETEQGLDSLLSQSPPPTAIVCNNDARALLVLKLLADRGICVPEDISVIGGDNVVACEGSMPPLTTVDNSLAAQGAAVVDYVAGRLEGRKPALPRAFPKLVVRESVRPLHSAAEDTLGEETEAAIGLRGARSD